MSPPIRPEQTPCGPGPPPFVRGPPKVKRTAGNRSWVTDRAFVAGPGERPLHRSDYLDLTDSPQPRRRPGLVSTQTHPGPCRRHAAHGPRPVQLGTLPLAGVLCSPWGLLPRQNPSLSRRLPQETKDCPSTPLVLQDRLRLQPQSPRTSARPSSRSGNRTQHRGAPPGRITYTTSRIQRSSIGYGTLSRGYKWTSQGTAQPTEEASLGFRAKFAAGP